MYIEEKKVTMSEEYIIRGPKSAKNLIEESMGQQLYDSLIQNSKFPTALTDAVTGESISYKTILKTSCRLAESLRKCGIKENDVIAIFSENSLEYFYPIIAALYLGCVVTTFNPQYMSGEILHATSISKPVVIFCSEMTLDSLLEVKQELKCAPKIVVIDTEDKQDNCETLKEFIDNNSNKQFDILNFKPAKVDINEQVALILYSSGTTGLPKGVMLTHKNIIATLSAASHPGYTKEFKSGVDVAIGLLPFFHAYGLCVVLACLMTGRQVIVLKSFDPEVFLQTIQNYKIATLFLVPPLANFLAKSPLVDSYDLSSVDMINCGAAPLSKRTQEVLMKRLNAKVFRQGYGLTETTLGVLAFPVHENRYGSCGKVLPNAAGKVIDPETGKALGPRQNGELCFKGDIIMKGYAGNAEATKKTIDEDGWLHTGDVGYYDEDGFFYIVDRIKELIKYKGFQVPPAELEAILLSHPKIVEAGVVGLPDETSGELPVAFVVTEPDQNLTEKEVQDFVAERVSPQKRLRGGVRFVSEIPKNPSGKILRRVLRELLVIPKSKL